MKVSRIELPTPYYVGPVNVWVLRGDAVVLVDGGIRSPEAREILFAKIDRVDAVLLTHSHPDHFGLARELRDRGAKIHVHADEKPYVETYPAPQRRVVDRYVEIAKEHGIPAEFLKLAGDYYEETVHVAEPAIVDRTVADGDVLEFGSIRLTAIHTPGHTSGSLCYAGHGRIFCGDTVLEKATPVSFFKGRRERTGIRHFRESLAKLKALEVREACPGHRRAFKDFAGAVRRIERHLEVRSKRVLDTLAEPKSAIEVAAEVFPGNPLQEQWVSFAETLGLLEDLEERGLVERWKDGEVLWRRLPSSRRRSP